MNEGYRILTRWLGALLVSVLFSAALLAQAGEGSLRGQVTDQSGAIIPAIHVTLAGPGGASETAQTDEQGRYAFHRLAPGDYSLRIDVTGFTPFERSGVQIVANRPSVVDVQLAVALEKQQVTVEGQAQRLSLRSESNASSLVLSGKDLDSLSDDPDELQDELQALAGPAAGPNGGQIYIDGFAGGQLPPKSEILEIRVNQNPFSAQYDRLGYGRIEITTKPGSQKFHGQVFTFANSSVLNSRSPFVTDQPGYHSIFSSGNIGGPIGKKVAFFFDVFRRESNSSSIVNAVVLDSNLNQTSFRQALASPGNRLHMHPRVDFQLSDKNVLSIRTEYSHDSNTNSGIGQFFLPSQAYDSTGNGAEIHVTDTQVISARTVNQLRFGFERDSDDLNSLYANDPVVNVRGAFTGGGNRQGVAHTISKHIELNNLTSMSLGKHSLSFGGRVRSRSQSDNSTAGFNGTFTFASLNAYQVVQLGLAQNMTIPNIITGCEALQPDPLNPDPSACGPSQFVVTTGKPLATVRLIDVGVYGEDEWRVKPNISLTLGLRFEGQNHIHDHADFAPRVGLAWGIGHGAHPATVLRAGFGIFYDRFGEGNILQAERVNGIVQQQYTFDYPQFFFTTGPSPDPSTLPGANLATSGTIYQIDPTLRSPYTIQSAIGLERQFSKDVRGSVTYINSHGVHQLLTRNINAPLPGTYDPNDPSTAVYPFGSVGNIYQYETDGLFNESQVITNFNVRAGAKLTLNGFYTLSYANSNAVGGGFPMNQYNLRQDYGPAPFVVRNQIFLGGSMALIRGFRLSPFMVINSGRPYNVTIGQDLNGDSIFNDRPAFAAAGATGPNIVSTPLGVYNIAPTAGEAVIPPNYLFGPSQFSMNARLAKTFGFGKVREGAGDNRGGWHRRERGLGGRGLGSGGGGGFFDSGNAESHRYQLEFSIMAHNVLNHVNLGTPVGNLSSPLFGQSTSLAGGFFNSQAANRSLNVMLRFSF
jgi:Carboxypeptidase regulatory-like domain